MSEAFAGWAAELNACFVTHNKLTECASTLAFAFNVADDRSFLVAEVFELLQVVRAFALVYFVEADDRAFEAASEVSVVYRCGLHPCPGHFRCHRNSAFQIH